MNRPICVCVSFNISISMFVIESQEGEEDEEPIIVSESDFTIALKNLQPSVSKEDLQQYVEMKQRMKANRLH